MTIDLLTVTDLKKHFIIGQKGILDREPIRVKAVDGISFAVREGETFGLVGESGSGKSTVAYTVVGMYQPTEGDIAFRGQSMYGRGRKRRSDLRKEIQIVFQDPGSSLNPRRTIKDIVGFPLRLYGSNEDLQTRILELLQMVELPADYMHKYPQMLGGGEKQMVAIARALATNPSFMILDEPTSALDVSIQAKIINLLLRLQREFRLSYLFITHDLSLMRNVASRVAIMYLGRICEIADAAEFFRNPYHPYTQMLLSSIPVVSDEEEQLKPKKITSRGEIPSPVNVPSGCSFHPRCPRSKDICSREDPALVEVEPGHTVSCHQSSQG
ncbi:MAG TPA: ABC transporter ATP-binding protein [Anaerolineae bacterium]|nr:ABC transporter ATP-binding protein [Anaerolineae bacterium]